MCLRAWPLFLLLAACSGPEATPPDTQVYTVHERGWTGARTAETIALHEPRAESVHIRHSGDGWNEAYPLTPQDGLWRIPVDALGLDPGAHEFKFLVNEEWEDGENRFLYLNGEGRSARPPALYLTWQRDPTTTMTVHWHSDHAEDPSVVRYRPADTEEWMTGRGEKSPFPFTERWVHTVELTGLSPGTRYAFQPNGAASVHFFETLPARLDAPLRFVNGGDVYHEKAWMDAMNRRAASLDPAFVVIGGDLAYADGAPENTERWYAYFESCYTHLRAPDGRMIPQLVAVGNHEVQRHFLFWHKTPEPTAEWRESAAPFFFKLFAFPGQPGYNVLDFGEYLSLVFLDTMHLNTIRDEQLEWMKTVFEERSDRPHLIPVYHVPAYPSFRNPDDAVSAEIREHWVPVFEAAGVRLASEYHDHTFKVTHPIRDGEIHPDGIVFIGDGAWGVYTRPIDDWRDRWYLRVAESTRHIFEIVIESDRRTIRAVTVDGRELDRFVQPVRRRNE